ncbi:glycoside hydrolase family 43 protein [Sphingomonas sp.]|uniref:glycoside hydrolase family 43 protein n=1 Tax=Sphingomonas sp. TaxID=28214 RepID=UPI00286E19FD|nr:glycoside hydrolase family 43 protein [Sphingomonas sp.]
MTKLVLVLAALLTGCAPLTAPLPLAPAAPVLDADFPDPAVIKAPDGFYYAYATQSEVGGKWVNLQVARSPDLLRWEHLGDALPAKPSWASKTQDFWAPHVERHGDTYYLYYSAKPDAALTDKKRGLCLAVATAGSPLGPFVDIGKPLQCGDGFVNIDPMAYDDPATGKRLLYWGSGFQPIKVQELAPDRISFAPSSAPADLIPVVKSEDVNEYRRLIEGAWVVRRGDYYYMFYSGDNCCGPKAHYAVLVARSRSATGPFEEPKDRPAVILERYGKWLAPGHNAVATDANGRDWIVYHAVDITRPRTKPSDDINTRRVMLVAPLVWEDGWPRVVLPR